MRNAPRKSAHKSDRWLWMMKVAFAGSFAVRMIEPVRGKLAEPCEVVAGDETGIVPRLADVDVLVSMGFTTAMAERGTSSPIGPGAGRRSRSHRPRRSSPGMCLANAYGHEAGIAEYVIGAMIALTRSFGRLDARLRQGRWESQWAVGRRAPPLWPELAGKTLGILGFGHIGEALARRAARLRHAGVCDPAAGAAGHAPHGVAFIGGPERLDEVLRQADYLAITLSLSPETRDLIDARRLRSDEADGLPDQCCARGDR